MHVCSDRASARIALPRMKISSLQSAHRCHTPGRTALLASLAKAQRACQSKREPRSFSTWMPHLVWHVACGVSLTRALSLGHAPKAYTWSSPSSRALPALYSKMIFLDKDIIVERAGFRHPRGGRSCGFLLLCLEVHGAF